MSVSLKAMLAACLGGVGLAFTVGTAALLHAEAGGRMQRMLGEQLHQYADQVADKLDRGMFERYRDLLVAASLDSVRSEHASRDSRRSVVQRLQDTYQNYAWIGFITPDGILEAATGRVLEGADVNGRAWWKQALQRPYVGDVHDAIALAKVLYGDRKEPPRFVDLAAPVWSEHGTLLGVVAAHLSWDWASEVERSVLGEVDKRRHLEAMILAADDTVILGPKALIGQRVQADSDPSSATDAQVWSDGIEYLTSVAATEGYGDYPGLGWKVVLREPMALAMAPVQELRDRVIAWGIAGSLFAVVIGYLLAGWISAPLRVMARTVEEAGSAGSLPEFPASGRYTEARTLLKAIQSYVDGLREADGRLKDSLAEKTALLHEVHHRVKNNLQIIYGMMMVEKRQLPKGERGQERMDALARRITAMGRLHEQLFMAGDLTRIDFADHLRQICDALSDLRPNDGVEIRVEAAAMICPLDLASPLGLIANELVMNALRHAFPAGGSGTVRVSLVNGAEELRLEVSDDGAGCPDRYTGSTGGTNLVTALARQIGGALSHKVENGCVISLSIPHFARSDAKSQEDVAV